MPRSGETDLVGRAVRGDREAFQTLYRKHHPQVCSIVSHRVRDRDDAQDLVQTVFVRAFTNLRSFREDAAFSTWLFRIAINTCNSFARSWWMRRVSLDQMEDPESFLHDMVGYHGDSPGRALDRKEARSRVRSQIRALPPRYMKPMWMRHVEDLPYAEIGSRLGLPMNTVKTHLHRGRRMLLPEPFINATQSDSIHRP
jgi:RNA polymerase sigma-70 factor (ECF subfamily)